MRITNIIDQFSQNESFFGDYFRKEQLQEFRSQKQKLQSSVAEWETFRSQDPD